MVSADSLGINIFSKKTTEKMPKVYVEEISKRQLWTINMQPPKRDLCTRMMNEEERSWKARFMGTS